MAKKWIGMIILLAAAATMLYPAFSTEKKEMPELIGKIKCNTGEYTAIQYNDGIRLYNSKGEMKAHYKPEGEEAAIISCCITDITGDSHEELLIIEGSGKEFYGNKLILLSCNNGLEKLYEREFKALNPWKIQACDVDGDGRKEIAMGVYKKAEFHPVMAKRPFFYHWENGDIVPVWRGSRLSRPFADYIFYDLDNDGKDELLAIETASDEKELINAYRWKGFGFESIAESGNYDGIIELVRQYKGEERLMIEVREAMGQRWTELEMINEKLVEK